MIEVIEFVDRYADMGINVIPLQSDTKVPFLPDWPNNPVGREFFESKDSVNLGLLLGMQSGGLADVDHDCDEAIALARSLLPQTNLIFGRASMPRSHYLYRVADCGGSKQFQFADGMLIEYRANGAQTMAPPSIHPSGEQVRFDEFGEPAEIERNVLLRAVSKVAAGSLLVRNWKPGCRHHLTLALCGGLMRSGWSEVEAGALIEAIAIVADDEELESRLQAVEGTAERLKGGEAVTGWPRAAEIVGEDVARKIAQWLGIERSSTQGSKQTSTASEPNWKWTDIGNAERFVNAHQDKAFFHADQGDWFVWDGTRWSQSRSGEIERLAHETAKNIFEEVQELGHHEQKEGYSWATRSCSNSRIKAMLDVSRHHLSVSTEQLDQQPFLFNCQSGTIELRTGGARLHDRSDLLTQISSVVYDPNAECPRFREFLRQITDGDEELIDFIQRAIGYSLTGDTSAQCLFILLGSGANGKSTLMVVLRSLLGEYATAVQAETLMQRPASGGPNPELARLVGARLVMVSEGERNHKFAESLVKQVTGGDPITARHLYQDPFEFVPQFKLWMPTNQLPTIEGTEEAIWRRIHVIPFDVTIPKDERDPHLPDKLNAELPGILNWALEGCRKWQEIGLQPPQRVQLATNQYRESMDPVAEFLEDSVMKWRNGRVPKSELFQAYDRWTMFNDAQKMSRSAFGARIKAMGYEERRESQTRYWVGIRLK